MSDLRDTLTNAAKSAAKTSGELFKSAKLNMNLSSAEGSLKNMYYDIGKKVHEIYLAGGSLGEWFDEKYYEILETEKKIFEIRDELDRIKGVRKCSRCEKSADRTAEFCPKCGMRFEPIYDTDATEPHGAELVSAHVFQGTEVIKEPTSSKKCRVCGSQNEASTKFCLSCGRIID